MQWRNCLSTRGFRCVINGCEVERGVQCRGSAEPFTGRTQAPRASGPGLPWELRAGDRDHALGMESESKSLGAPRAHRGTMADNMPSLVPLISVEARRKRDRRQKAEIVSLHMRHI